MFLNCHTAFSFKYGTLSVQRLFDEARRCGVHKLALTEINNTTSYIEMLRLCAERASATGETPYALDVAVGVEFRNNHDVCFIALARNNAGFVTISHLLSQHNLEARSFPAVAPAMDNVFVIYPFGSARPENLRSYEYIGVGQHQLNRFAMSADRADHPDKFVLLHPVTFANKKDFNAHRLLRAIANNTLLSKLPEHQQARPDEIMVPEVYLEKALENFPELIQNTRDILDHCSITPGFGEDKNKKHVTGSEESDWDMLVAKTWEGFADRYRHASNDSALHERVNKELRTIRNKKFCAYYLISYDLIQFAKSKGFDFVGRGSGANSIVAYCLGITNVDPVDLNLYFERFLNPERSSPPDFDIDFSWDNRDAIYEYIFNRYGRDHVCLLGTHVTYQKRSILRELGKVFGLPRHEIDALVEEPWKYADSGDFTRIIVNYAEYMQDWPSNLSIHAGGVLITEKPVYATTAVDLPPKGYPVSHCEMHNAEDIGLFKFDILSQRGLGHLKEAVRHVQRNQGIAVDIHRIDDFKEDEKIKDLLRSSRTMGCFYVESPGMRMLLGKLRCDDYLTLVAASSIIRPGVASSGMMRTYIERFHAVRNGQTYASIHPTMHELLAETYGVMVYQEDVIKVAHYFAGLSLEQADVLRRGMSGKYRSRDEFKRVETAFFENCRARGYAQDVIDRVWFEIESFSGYSFAKGHSASYAVESYQSLYLKAHYPLEFMVGVINNFGGFYKTEYYFHEARMSGAAIEAPCINHSDYLTTIYGTQIYIGFVHLKSLDTRLAQEIGIDRARNGVYHGLEDFIMRIKPGLEQVRLLIRIGAFRFTGKNKQRLLWEAMLLINQARLSQPATASLFDTEPKEYPLPALQRHTLEDAYDEIELLGFPLCNPFNLIHMPQDANDSADVLGKAVGHSVYIIGYLVTIKETRTKDRKAMNFGTFYDQQGNFFDTVHFPDTASRYPFRGRGFYAIKGRVAEDFGVTTIEVTWMDKVPMINRRAEEFMREELRY